MRKTRIIFMVILVMVMNSVPVYGNTGPVTWHQYPDISLMTIDEDTPVSVLKENLDFDFSEDLDTGFSLAGKVSARYTMKNMDKENILSKMVFPFIQDSGPRNEELVEVLIDGEPIAYKIYYGKNVEEISSDGDFNEKVELEDILESITEKPYVPKNYNYQDKGTLYRIHLEAAQVDPINVEGSFTLKNKNSRILCKGNDSYGFDDTTNDIMVGTWTNNEKTILEIFSFDEDLEIALSGFKYVKDHKKEINDFKFTIEEIEMDLITYYKEFLTTNEMTYSSFQVPEDKNIYYEALDQALINERIITQDHINSYISSPRYVLIAYEVPFEALEERNVEVIYYTMGSMDKTTTVVPTYTYGYFLHPAKYWRDFHNLTITITPSATYPYVLDSNLKLDREGDGTYRGSFETLPKEDFSFMLYEKETITTIDKIKGVAARSRYFFYFIGVPLLALALVIIVGIVTYRITKSKMNPNNKFKL